MNVSSARMARAAGGRVPDGALRRVAAVGALCTFVVLLMAASMRMRSAGLGCDPWPACLDAARSLQGVVPSWVRLAHRVAATVAALCALAAVGLAWRGRHGGTFARSLAALGGVALLAVLGRASGAGASPAVALSNLLGGMALLAVFVDLFCRPADASEGVPATGWHLFVIVAVPVVLGAVVGTHDLARQCPGVVLCGATEGLSSGAAWWVQGHRIAGVAAVAWLVVRAVRQWRAGTSGAAATVLALLITVQATVGVMQSLAGLPLPLALAHHSLAALTLSVAVAARPVGSRERRRI